MVPAIVFMTYVVFVGYQVARIINVCCVYLHQICIPIKKKRPICFVGTCCCSLSLDVPRLRINGAEKNISISTYFHSTSTEI